MSPTSQENKTKDIFTIYHTFQAFCYFLCISESYEAIN